MGVDEGIVVAGSAQAVGEGGTATGAVACCWLGAGVACPHEPVLFVVTEVLALSAAGTAFAWHGSLGGSEADDVAGRVVDQGLRENGAAGATAALPAGAGTGGKQVGIVAELLVGQRITKRGLEVDGVHLGSCVIDHGGQVRGGGAVVTHPGVGSRRAVVDLAGGVPCPVGFVLVVVCNWSIS